MTTPTSTATTSTGAKSAASTGATGIGEPVAAGLFTWPAEAPQLVAGRCRACGSVAFPRPPSCARCTSEDVGEHLLATRGTLWSWTVQRFRPKEPFIGPEPFEPYGVGYVDIDGEVLVEARLTTADPGVLRIGMAMDLVIVPFTVGGDGSPVLTFAFGPASEEAR